MDDADITNPTKTETDEGFLRLFVRNEQALRIYARALVPTWDAVDDVLQEASVVMWRKLGQLDSHNNFLPWAKVIVRFEALRCRRKFARDRLVFSEELLGMLADQSADREEDELVVEKAMLKRCLDKLSSSNRELVLAPYAGSGRVKELAIQSNRTSNSLYKLLGRLRTKIQGCVENEVSATLNLKHPGNCR